MLERVVHRSAVGQTTILELSDPVPQSTGSRWSIPARAFTFDLVLLVSGMAVYVIAMVEANRLYRRWETPGQAAGLIIGWLVLILVYGGYDSRYVGVGTEEFKRVLSASVALLALVSAFTYVVLPTSPPLRLVIPSVAVGSTLLLLERWLLWSYHHCLRR